MTLKKLLKRILPYIPENKVYSIAHGIVKVDDSEENKIIVTDADGNKYEYDENGKISHYGQTLLLPINPEIRDWSAYEKFLIKAYNTNLTAGDICLVKENAMSDWILAIYEGPGKARVSREITSWFSWMRYKGNEDYLGRAIIPDWMQ